MTVEKYFMLLQKVRAELAKQGLAAVLVMSADPHNSEYIAPCFQRRGRLCGFSGSAGTCIVTEKEALLWTDGRYWLEAAATLYPDWTLMKDRRGDPTNVTPEDWLVKNLADGATVGVDGATMTEHAWSTMSKRVALRPTTGNAVDAAEGQAPARPAAAVFVHEDRFAGESREAKLAKVAEKLRDRRCGFTVISALDEVAWLFNLRGADVPFNPVFYAFAAVSDDGLATLFVDGPKIPADVKEALARSNVSVAAYDGVADYVRNTKKGSRCAIDTQQASHELIEIIRQAGSTVVEGPSIVQFMKAVKSSTEREGFKAAHRRDGAALTRFLAWLEQRVTQQEGSANPISEHEAATKLESLRREMPHFVQLSFETIPGAGPNGAIIHYRAPEVGSAPIVRSQLFLVDSGAQYLDGTTDVTRTVCFDAPKPKEVEAYTYVLKGHIALNSAVFPSGIAGTRLDAFARNALWGVGWDYGHGTGHGVGHFLNVHEGPHGIGVSAAPHNAGLMEHMIVSNEPGFYADGEFGIRIENLDLIVAQPTKYKPQGFLTLESLTRAPLCRDLIDKSLLTDSEISWVDRYHEQVAADLIPFFTDEHELDALATKYVHRHCEKL